MRASDDSALFDANDASTLVDATDDLDDLERPECSWPCSTVLHATGVVDNAFIDVMAKYFRKRADTLWQPSFTNSDGASEVDDGDEMADKPFRQCSVAKDTRTLQRLCGMIDSVVEDVIESFIEKYPYFSIVSTKDAYTILKFAEDDFYSEHIEVSGLDEDNDGAARRLCVMVFLSDTPERGGVLTFPYQNVQIRVKRGDVVVFPACPLHPNSISPVTCDASLIYAYNYLM